MNYTVSVGANEKMRDIQSFLLYFSFGLTRNSNGLTPNITLNGFCSAFLSIQHSEAPPFSPDWGRDGTINVLETNSGNTLSWYQGQNLQTIQAQNLNSIITFSANGDPAVLGGNVAQITDSFVSGISETGWQPQPISSSQLMNRRQPLALTVGGTNHVLSVIHLSTDQVLDGYVSSFSSDGGVFKTVHALLDGTLPTFTFPATNSLNYQGSGCGIVAQGLFKKHLALTAPQTLLDLSHAANGTANMLQKLNGILASEEILANAETCNEPEYRQADYISPDDAIEMMLFQR